MSVDHVFHAAVSWHRVTNVMSNLSNITKACVAVNTSSLGHFVHHGAVQE